MDERDLCFICKKLWEELEETESDIARYCPTCSRHVIKCHTRAQLAVASSLKRCVAITAENEIIGWIGEPLDWCDWMEEPKHSISICQKSGHKQYQTEILAMLYPQSFTPEVVQRFNGGSWISLGTFNEFVAKGILEELNEEDFGILIQHAELDALR